MNKVRVMLVEYVFNKMNFLLLSVCTLLFITISSQVFAGGRFEAPVLNAPLEEFDKRVGSGDLNVDFIVALTFNKARKIERETRQFLDENTALYRDLVRELTSQNSNSNFFSDSNSAISNSVVLPPGTRADEIIIINQNEGDSFAIQR